MVGALGLEPRWYRNRALLRRVRMPTPPYSQYLAEREGLEPSGALASPYGLAIRCITTLPTFRSRAAKDAPRACPRIRTLQECPYAKACKDGASGWKAGQAGNRNQTQTIQMTRRTRHLNSASGCLARQARIPPRLNIQASSLRSMLVWCVGLDSNQQRLP